jgi:hypothetical protein
MSNTTQKKIGLSLISMLVAGLLGTGVVINTVGAADPLIVSCSSSVATDTVAWTATSSGGEAPYAYVWSGSGVSGTSSTNTVTYNSTGTFTATIEVTDSATSTNTATSSCLATIVSLPSVVATTTPATTTPHFARAMLSVNPNGHFLARGMKVSSIGSNSFQAEVWGVTYTINIPTFLPEFFVQSKSGGQFDINQVHVGDELGVLGEASPGSPLIVQAKVIRNYSLINPRSKDERKNKSDSDDDDHKFKNTKESSFLSSTSSLTINFQGKLQKSVRGKINSLFKKIFNR